MNAGDLADAAIRQTDRMLRNAERERAFRDYHLSKKDKLHPVDYKRPLQENGSVPSLLNVNSAKRLRATAENSVTSSQDIKIISDAEGTGSTQNPVGLNVDSKLTPLQQMIAMIGALVAKGERAASSIEILITSLPPDMLADVVIENMKNLPTSPPALPSVANVAGSSDAQANMTGSLKADEAPALPPVNIAESPKSVQTAADHRRDPRRDPRRMDPRRSAVPVGGSRQTVSVAAKLEEPVVEPSCSSSGLASTLVLATVTPVPDSTAPVLDIPSVHLEVPEVREEVVSRSITVQPNGSSWREAEISLDQKAFDIPSDSRNENVGVSADSSGTLQLESVALPAASSLVAEPSSIPGPLNTDSQISAAQCTDTAVSPVSFVPTVQVEPIISDQVRSEAVHTLSSTSMAGPAPATPFVPLNDSQQLALWKVLFLRILEKHVVPESACSSNLRFSLLPRLISQCIADEEAIMILQDFILADYHNHKGHELTMHMLYQLYGDKTSGDRAIVASKVYDDFLIAVAQGIRETLPPTDKSLSRLFSEAPMIPVGALKWLESICNPSGTDVVNGERIFQGLSAVWILILLRPPLRAECLEIALKCAVHEVDEVRTKAIRLVANKLYPLPYNSQRIEDFAMSMLYDVVGREHNEEGVKSLGCEAVPQRQPTLQVVNDGEDSLATADKQAMHGNSVQQDRHQGGKVNLSIGEAQRCMSLYFALCTKKVSLLRHLFEMYENAPKAVKQAAHRNMPVLIRTIGSNSSDLLQLLSDPPHGSKNLILLVLHLLTEADPPSHDLIAIVKQLYESKIKDARLLTPILSSLSKAEVLPIFPHLVALPTEDFKAALDRILQGSVHTGPALTPAEVLVAIHAIDPERDHIPLAMVKDACSVCFQQRTVFTQQVLAKVLNQLVEQTPIPMLFMRTVILAVGTFRSLVSFVMEILSRLVSKQIWKWPNLWIGFLKCADQTQPHSFHVLLQLPAVQLDKALHKHPNLRAPLTNYASKPTVRSNLARPVLVVLGLIQDGVSSDPASHSQAVPNATTTILENQIRETTTS
ncbi:hypothetical protein KP509_01G050700 [Ceratopteris richardii]|nr:hypothetical protein KP509_01G050700 [Ceratopteris richardii]